MRSTMQVQMAAAGVAIMGAGVLAGTPGAGNPVAVPEAFVAHPQPDVELTANSIAYIPINLINALASLPANEVLAVRELTAALNYSGNWFTWNPRHVEGWDYGDTLKLEGLVNVLLPFLPGAADALSDQINGVALAEIPWNEGCTGIPGPCDDPAALYGGYFQVPLSELLAGYTYDPNLVNPIGGAPAEWAGQTFTLDVLAPLRAAWDSLTAEPTGVATVSLEEVLTTIPELVDALVLSFNPLHPGSVFYGPPYPRPLDSTNFTWLDAIFGNLGQTTTAVEANSQRVAATSFDSTITDADAAVTDTDALGDTEETDEAAPTVDLDLDLTDGPIFSLLSEPETESEPDTAVEPETAAEPETEVEPAAPETEVSDAGEDAPDAEPDSGRHRAGIPAYRIIDRLTNAGDTEQDDDSTSRRGFTGSVREVTERLTSGLTQTPASQDRTGGDESDGATGGTDRAPSDSADSGD